MSSGLEIERKFLVHKNMDWKSQAYNVSHVRQGYFAAINTVRIRIRDTKGYLTIKGKSVDGGLSRYEFEKEITLEEAEQLTFEIDEFHGENEGLVMAEVELESLTEPFEKPNFIGIEVTGDPRFYNRQMRNYPFTAWKETLPAEYR